MNWDRVKGNWKNPDLKGKVKEQWGKLTDEDLDAIDGKRDQLIGKIQERYHIKHGDAEREVDGWTTIVAHHDYKPPRRDPA